MLKQCDFFEIISSVLEDTNTDSSYNIILGGDFNVHFNNSALDNLGGRMVAKSSVQNIKELMLAHDLVDQEKMKGQRGTLRALAGICQFHLGYF